MRYTIKGLTDRTITLNELKITIRGDCKNPTVYPHSVAYHIDVTHEGQYSELNAMVNAGYLEIVPEEAPKQEVKETPKKEKAAKKAKTSKPVKSGKQKDPKTAPKTVPAKSVVKPIKRAEQKTTDLSEDTIIVNADGIVQRGKMTKSSDIDLTESEITRASIEAAKKIDEDERLAENQEDLDESKLDMSERMGNSVVVGSGEHKVIKTKILKSVLPTIKTNWVDLNKDRDSNYSDAFIDPPSDDKNDKSTNDAFIE